MMLRSRRRPPAPPTVVLAPASQQPHDGVNVPYGVRFAAAWSWRVLLIMALIYVLLQLFTILSVVLIPVIVGLLLSAVASPAVDRLTSWGMARGLATALVLVTGIVALVSLVTLVAQQFSSGFGDLRDSFNDSLDKVRDYLTDLGLTQRQLDDFIARAQDAVSGSGQGDLGGTVAKATTTAGHVLAGVFIALFATIFFTYDGRGIWQWVVRLFPDSARTRVNGSGVRAWAVLTSYVRATFLIALVDAIGISLVAFLLGLDLVLPIGVLVFIGSFIPVVGATISGIAAVAVALVSQGPVDALLMLGGVIAVQQLESHILQPFLLGRLVQVHPLAVVLVIGIGGFVAGIFGALIAVPLTAIINAVGTYLAGERRSRLEQEAGAAADPAVT
jgi:predicted PurR-regulated permease PerM